MKYYLISTKNINGEKYNTIVDKFGLERHEVLKKVEVTGDKVGQYNEAVTRINVMANQGEHDVLSWEESKDILNEIVEDYNF